MFFVVVVIVVWPQPSKFQFNALDLNSLDGDNVVPMSHRKSRGGITSAGLVEIITNCEAFCYHRETAEASPHVLRSRPHDHLCDDGGVEARVSGWARMVNAASREKRQS